MASTDRNKSSRSNTWRLSDGGLWCRTRIGGDFRGRGHTTTWMVPPYVKLSDESNTHHTAGAEAMRKVVTRPTMRVLPFKALAQRDIQPRDQVREGR
jgi:hypothetical protein